MLSHSQTLQACAFRAGGHCFAVESDCVEEVLRTAALTRVPLAPESIVGLLHLRGRIVAVIDVCRRLGLPAAPADASPTNLVIRVADDCYSLLVDEVLDVHAIDRDRIEQPTAQGGTSTADAVSGVFAAESRLIHILSPERLVQPLQKQRSIPFVRHGVSHGGHGG